MHTVMQPMALAVVGSVAALFAERASAGDCTLELPTELLAPLPSAVAQFGYAVALDGDTLLAGEPTKRLGPVDDVGAAQIFRWNGCWTLEQSLADTNAEEGDRFGQSLALQGDRALVGIPGDRPGSPANPRSGSVDYWERAGSLWSKHWQFTPSDPSESQLFGHAVAIDGSLVVVGAPGDDDGGENAGALYVFRWGDGAWRQEAKLVSPNAQPGDQFGWSVAASGGTIVASAPFADVDGTADVGWTVVYRLREGEWSLDQQIGCDGCAASAGFGWAVALHEDVLVVGSPRGADPGAAYVFRQQEQGFALEQQLVAGFVQLGDEHFGESVAVRGSAIAVGDYTGPDPEFGFPVGAVQLFHFNGAVWRDDGTVFGEVVGNANYFGFSCSLDERRLVVGAPRFNTVAMPGDAGLVTIFDVAGGEWSGTSTIMLPSIASGELLGSAVAVSQDTALIGAPEAASGGVVSGVVELVDLCDGAALKQQTLTPNDPLANQLFGSSLAIEGDVAAVGAPGAEAVYVFIRAEGAWSQLQKVVASDGQASDAFGHSVDIDGDTMVVGARFDDTAVEASGSAFVFRWDGASWNEEQKLAPSDGSVFQYFGWSVAVSGDWIAVGARQDDCDGAGSDCGAAYLFHRAGSVWTQTQKVKPAEIGYQDWFGSAVALEGSSLLVGATLADNQGSASGAVYSYSRSGNSWLLGQTLVPSSGAAGATFGWSVSLDVNIAAIGSPGGSGAVTLFRHDCPLWTEITALTGNDAGANSWFGQAVSIRGTHIGVGAPEADVGGSGSPCCDPFAMQCDDPECIAAVARLDPFCEVIWDFNCAELAADLCEACVGIDSGSAFLYVQTCVAGVTADLNGDGIVDSADLGLLLAAWGPCSGCAADLDGNEFVDGADLGTLLGAWGPVR